MAGSLNHLIFDSPDTVHLTLVTMPPFERQIQIGTGWGRTLEQFATWCAPQAGWLAMDVGCGAGLLPALLEARGCTTLGVDLENVPPDERLFSYLAQADACRLPFPAGQFDLVTASNLLFFLSEPQDALREFLRLLRPSGQVCLLNPSERMSIAAASALAEEHHLDGLARRSLLVWAARAEAHARWDEAALQTLLATAGLTLVESCLRVGPGLARFARAVIQ